ncbi:3'-5' exonuclease domain-containing protein [Ditylenchus destructor]|nr:3'-5' exonuclease domain-containing protein [Ditylenchus destructor]
MPKTGNSAGRQRTRRNATPTNKTHEDLQETPQIPSGSHAVVSNSKELADKLQQTIVGIVKASNGLPKLGDGYELYASYPDYAQLMAQNKGRILAAMRKIMANSSCKVRIPQSGLEDIEKIVSANDLLIERVGTSFDEHQTMRTQQLIETRRLETGAEIIPGSAVLPPQLAHGLTERDGGGKYARLADTVADKAGQTPKTVPIQFAPVFPGYSTHITVKPQTMFSDAIINADAPFVPKLREKVNAMERKLKGGLRIIDEESIEQEHPYLYELDHFSIPTHQLIPPSQEKAALPVEDTDCVLIDSESALIKFVEDLNNENEFAVDVEHHSYRSFLGMTCLVQISTRTVDYVIDPFPIWKSMWRLNEPFSNPKILKVFHDGSSDVIWLQRDFGIYTTNIFDTSIAMRLNDPACKTSLKQLLQDQCDVDICKDLQKTDWRLRPLPENYIHYARLDAHYLLYCYDKLRSHLSQHPTNESVKIVNDTGKYVNVSSLIKKVFDNSHKLAYQVFEQPRFDPDGHLELAKQSRRKFNNRQMAALKQLYAWRDSVAREHDESLHYVLPTHMMIHIAEVMPKETQGILACCAPVPPHVKFDAVTILRLLNAVRDIPLDSTATISGKYIEASLTSLSRDRDDINKITPLVAKLQYKFDMAGYKADEGLPSIDARLKCIQDPKFAESKQTADIPLLVGPKSWAVSPKCTKQMESVQMSYVEDKLDEKKAAEVNTKLKRVLDNIKSWASPFELYVLGRKEKAKEKEPEVVIKQETP